MWLCPNNGPVDFLSHFPTREWWSSTNTDQSHSTTRRNKADRSRCLNEIMLPELLDENICSVATIMQRRKKLLFLSSWNQLGKTQCYAGCSKSIYSTIFRRSSSSIDAFGSFLTLAGVSVLRQASREAFQLLSGWMSRVRTLRESLLVHPRLGSIAGRGLQ